MNNWQPKRGGRSQFYFFSIYFDKHISWTNNQFVWPFSFKDTDDILLQTGGEESSEKKVQFSKICGICAKYLLLKCNFSYANSTTSSAFRIIKRSTLEQYSNSYLCVVRHEWLTE